MSSNVTCKLIGSHLLSGAMTPGEEIAIHIDQTLTQDATGTLVMQELEALGLDPDKLDGVRLEGTQALPAVQFED